MAWFGTKSIPQGVQMGVELPVAFIQDGDTVVAYTPALDLSTCGATKEEAQKMFEEATEIFFNDLVENNTVDEVLSGLGWTRTSAQKSQAPQWTPPKISQESIAVNMPSFA